MTGRRPAALRAAVGESLEPPLPVPPEPVELRARLLELAAVESPAAARRLLAAGDAVASVLWAAWAGPLLAAGIGREGLAAHAGRAARELWLWLAGERTWHEVAALVAGGALRRAGGGGGAGVGVGVVAVAGAHRATGSAARRSSTGDSPSGR